jgi:cytochrome c oxidase subunit 3
MENQQTYYVPESSKLPLFASLGLFLTVFGLANVFNENDGGGWLTLIGFIILGATLWVWFSATIEENMKGLNSAQVKRSYVWGMGWFIFSEVMFFGAFFGALYYVRVHVLPGLSEGPTAEILWPGFEAQWPLTVTPDMAANGASAKVLGPEQTMAFPGWAAIFTWLPFINTAILLSSSVTVHFAHTGILNNNRKQFNMWLGITVLLGIIFLCIQVYEYYEAYHHLGLTLDSGIYGATFFMLTGFHGFHVLLGTFMLLVMFLRSVLKGHFRSDDAFGFEAASWYWHFVDVVWLGLFIFVYILG